VYRSAGYRQNKSSGKEEPAALFQVEVPGIRRRRRVMFFLIRSTNYNAPSSELIVQKTKTFSSKFQRKYPSG
jgi:hypothetical protein